MKHRIRFIVGVWLVFVSGMIAQAEVKIVVGHNPNEDATFEFKFKEVPSPSRNDAATEATFTVVDGRREINGGGVEKLHDGRVPQEEDAPSENFFFSAGTTGGRLLVDLGSAIAIRQVNTYSWHPDTRGPQVYQLYASDGQAADFNPQPKRGINPETCGWKRVAIVDTRPDEGDGGGQYGVGISAVEGTLGKYRYLLFDISRTEASDPFGNTFYSEIDVDDGRVRETVARPTASSGREIVEAEGGYQITLDTSETPDLTEWVHQEVAPVTREWYPKLVKLLPSEGFEAPKKLSIVFRPDMQGVAATSGTRISCAASWYRRNLKGEVVGSIVHEMVHVVQQYGRARRANPGAVRPPGWLVEGLTDYIRWFLYEPQSHGAEITPRNISRAQYDGNYRITANFLNWVIEKYDRDFLRELNTAIREGTYTEATWKEHTGHAVQELGDEWKQAQEKKLAAEAGPP